MVLAEHFGKSRQTITNVTHEETDFSGITAGEAFDLGTRAEKLAQSLKRKAAMEPGLDPSAPVQSGASVTPLHMFRLKKLRERQEKREFKRLIFRRMLASLNKSTMDSSSELPEEERPDEPFTEDQIMALELAGQVLKNMQSNLQKKDKRGWRYNKEIVDLGYMISRRSQAAYEMLRQVLPMPSRQTLTSAFGEMEQTLSAGCKISACFISYLRTTSSEHHWRQQRSSCSAHWLLMRFLSISSLNMQSMCVKRLRA